MAFLALALLLGIAAVTWASGEVLGGIQMSLLLVVSHLNRPRYISFLVATLSSLPIILSDN
jgi:hypothetical protein